MVIEIKKQVPIKKPIAQVWALMANQFNEAYLWASSLSFSEGYGNPTLTQAQSRGRYCKSSFGEVREEITVFDHTQHILSYKVVQGFPAFVKHGVNTWSLQAQAVNQTALSIHFQMQFGGLLGRIMAPIMKRRLKKVIQHACEEFAYYMETGKRHPRKVKADKRLSPVA